MTYYMSLSETPEMSKFDWAMPDGYSLHVYVREGQLYVELRLMGEPQYQDTLLSGLSGNEPYTSPKMTAAAQTDRSFAVAYLTDDGEIKVLFVQMDADGRTFYTETSIIAREGNTLNEPLLQPLSDGRYMLVYGEQGETGDKVLAQIVDAEGVRINDPIELADNRNTMHDWAMSRVVLEDGSYVILWRDDADRFVGQHFLQSGEKVGIVTGMDLFFTDAKWTLGLEKPLDAGITPHAQLTENGDIVHGTDGNDSFWADPGGLTDGDVISGGGGTDTITLLKPGTLDISAPETFDSIEVLQGSDGDDTFVIDAEHFSMIDTFDGGDGEDVIQLKDGGTYDFSVKTLIGIEKIMGSEQKDRIIGTSGDDRIDGTYGWDSGGDLLEGGKGDDTYWVNTWLDVIIEKPGEGTDTVMSNLNSYILPANIENIILSHPDAFEARGNSLDNIMIDGREYGGYVKFYGEDGDDTLIAQEISQCDFYGGNGNDTLVGSRVGVDGRASWNTLRGGQGNDKYYVNSARTYVYEEGNGHDIIYSSVSFSLSGGYVNGNVEDLTLTGTEDLDGTGNGLDNVMTGNSGNNRLYGLGGNDTIDGGLGADHMEGGTGDDTYVVDSLEDVVVEKPGEGTDTVIYTGFDVYYLAEAVENLILRGPDAYYVYGNGLDNVITDETSLHSEGSDFFRISLYGDAGNDTLIGGVNFANLYGGTGNDTLISGKGGGELAGGSGDDTYYVNSDNVTIYELDRRDEVSHDKVYAAVSFSLSGPKVVRGRVEDLTLTGTGDLDGTGTSLANVLSGNSGNNKLYGLDGNDTLYGGAGDDLLDGGTGADRMEGGTGSDTYVVDNSGDTVTEVANISVWHAIDSADRSHWLRFSEYIANIEKADRVNSSINYTLGDHVEILSLTGSAAINGTGNSLDNALCGNGGNNVLKGMDGSDAIWGGAGNDTLEGGNGDDTLDGGSGRDIMTGGAGADHFVFGTAFTADPKTGLVSSASINGSADTITDFSHADGDRIVLSLRAFHEINGKVGQTLTADQFVAGAYAKDANDHILYDEKTGQLWYDENGSSANAAGWTGRALIAQLNAGTHLDASDFLFVA